jgi:hypothetical protein
MHSTGSSRWNLLRRGVAKVQWVIIAACIVVVLFVTVSLLGNHTSDQMDKVAEGVADPAALTKQFGKKAN